jgi:hypothetical protein
MHETLLIQPKITKWNVEPKIYVPVVSADIYAVNEDTRKHVEIGKDIAWNELMF